MARSQQPALGKAVVGKPKEETRTGVKITAAIFFDGTGNNLNNTTQRLIAQKKINVSGLTATGSYQRLGQKNESYKSYYSNVALLYFMNTKIVAANREVSVYVEGIGTEDDGLDDDLGNGFGAGMSGLPAKVNREKKAGAPTDGGIAKLVSETKKVYDNKSEFIKQFTISVFGFSRGAAAARYFIARKAVLCQKLCISPSVVTYQFVGLFDTVSSYEPEGKHGVWGNALSHDFGNDVQELSLALRPGADQITKVVQFVAGDECRENFASTTIASAIRGGVGYELVLPGAHSDVGGGYGELEDEPRQLDGPDDRDAQLAAGWYTAPQIVTEQRTEYDLHDMQRTVYTYTGLRRGLTNKYQYVTLAAMRELATKYGLSFSAARLYSGISLAVPADLAPVQAEVVKYALDNDGAHRKVFAFPSLAQQHFVRQHYLHRSGSIGILKDGRQGMNMHKEHGLVVREFIAG